MKWLILFTVAVIGCLLIGDGILPLTSSEGNPQSTFVGWVMIAAGAVCLIYVAVNVSAMRKKDTGRD